MLGDVVGQKLDGSVHNIQYARWILNISERNYNSIEREALEVILAISNFRIYLLSFHPFELIMDHQALRYVFMKNDVHGRLQRWLEFIAEYDFRVVSRPGIGSGAAEFMSPEDFQESPLCSGEDDAQVTMVALFSSLDMGPFLVNVKRYLSGAEIIEEDDMFLWGIRCTSKSFYVSNYQICRRTPLGPKIIFPKSLHLRALEAFHDCISLLNVETR